MEKFSSIHRNAGKARVFSQYIPSLSIMTDKIVSHAIEQGIDFLFANRLSQAGVRSRKVEPTRFVTLAVAGVVNQQQIISAGKLDGAFDGLQHFVMRCVGEKRDMGRIKEAILCGGEPVAHAGDILFWTAQLGKSFFLRVRAVPDQDCVAGLWHIGVTTSTREPLRKPGRADS